MSTNIISNHSQIPFKSALKPHQAIIAKPSKQKPNKTQCSKSLSPKKSKSVLFDPESPPIQQENVNPTGKLRYLAPPFVPRRHKGGGFAAVETDEIQKRLVDFQGTDKMTSLPFAHDNMHLHSHPESSEQSSPPRENVPHLLSPPQIHTTHSPKTPPRKINASFVETSDGIGSCCGTEAESDIDLPHYTSYFHPRLPSPTTGKILCPIPKYRSIQHALMIKEALTTFHIGVIMIDEWAKGDWGTWCQGLKMLVNENMQGLKNLGVQPHHIIFFYHGRGKFDMGNDIWSAIMTWQKEQQNMARRGHVSPSGHENSYKREFVGSPKQEVVGSPGQEAVESVEQEAVGVAKQEIVVSSQQQVIESAKQEDFGQNEQELRQQEIFRVKEAEREKIRQTNEDAKKWNDFAKQEASRS